MAKNRWFLIIFFLYFLGFFTHALYLRKTVYGDGIFYYAWLRSVIIDHDVNFRDEYDHFSVNSLPTPSGFRGNKYSIGPALLWLPAYSLIHSIVRGNGYGLPYQLVVGLSSVLYTITGLILLYRLLTKFFRPNVGTLTVLATAFATNLLFYGSLDTVNSHSLSFFAAMLFLSLLFSNKKSWLAVGASLGLLGTIRTQDLALGMLVLPFLNVLDVLAIRNLATGLLITFLPQLTAWQALYGTFWVSPYLVSGESFNFFRPHVLAVLFSTQNGLFLYSPILLLGILGLFFWKNPLRRWLLSVIVLELLVVASWSTWWQGASYGGRMFVSSLPLLAFGLANAFDYLRRHGWGTLHYLSILIGPLTALNMLLVIFFLLFGRR